MKIEADTLAVAQTTAKITHKNETATFIIAGYQRKSFQEEHDVFEYLNLYWNDLSESEQDEVFAIYKEFDAIFNSFGSRDEIREALMVKTNELMSYHTLERMERWIVHKSDIQIPSHIVVDFKDDINNNMTRDKTYIRADYKKLITLCMSLKCMLPIWGQEIFRVRRDVGNKFKESHAFELISGTEIVQCDAYHKLETYVNGIIEKDRDNTTMIVEGISPEIYGQWVTSMICVLRLTIGDIRGINDPDRDMCRYIYKFITQKVRNNDSNNENGIRDKERENPNNGSENKTSNIESFKQTTDLTVGEAAELQISLEDPYAVATALQPGIDLALVETSLKSVKQLNGMKLAQPQIVLTQWIVKQITTPYAVDHIEPETMVDLIGVVEAVLWTRGHKYLALLVSAYPINDDSLHVIAGGESRARIPVELLDQINKYYPYQHSVNVKRMGTRDLSVEDLNGRRSNTLQVNKAVEAIDTMTANLSYHSWRPTASEDKLQEILGTNVRRLPVRSSIKIDLAKLVIEIGSRSYIN